MDQPTILVPIVHHNTPLLLPGCVYQSLPVLDGAPGLSVPASITHASWLPAWPLLIFDFNLDSIKPGGKVASASTFLHSRTDLPARLLQPWRSMNLWLLCLAVTYLSRVSARKGSGSVIRGLNGEQFILTAAHNLVDNEYGCAHSVILATGFGTTLETTRYGTFAVVHAGYYSMRWDVNDIAFIVPNTPFHNTRALRYRKTPKTERMLVNVFGYPKDAKNLNFKPCGRLCVSREAYMSYSPPSGDVYHFGNTEEGSSGGPILDLNNAETVVAVHTGSHPERDRYGIRKANLGAPINRSGNGFEPLLIMLNSLHHGNVGNLDIPAVVGPVKTLGSKAVAFTWDPHTKSSLATLANVHIHPQPNPQEPPERRLLARQFAERASIRSLSAVTDKEISTEGNE
ncbi:hypothetical protein QBC44DRAFT_354912 [Cladorrhinum sp. PSN332]|nr:hypothetical protein QBC44DRAFT_354912 [Cladorrhinum sp. PSN332]